MVCNESRQQNPPLENAKSATVQMQNDYQMSRHRQSTPAARCKEQCTKNPKAEKVTTSNSSAKTALTTARKQKKFGRNFRTKCQSD